MRKSLLLITIFLLFYFSAFIKVRAQFTAVRCSRTTIESYAEHERRPVLQYMDEARQFSDEFMRLLAGGKFDEIYNIDKKVRIWIQESPAKKVDLAGFEQTQGKIINFQYRNQDIIWYLTSAEINLRGTVGTWYAVKTTKTKNGFASLLVETHKARGEQKLIFEAGYFKASEPGWLNKTKPPIERGNCPSYNGSLIVNGP